MIANIIKYHNLTISEILFTISIIVEIILGFIWVNWLPIVLPDGGIYFIELFVIGFPILYLIFCLYLLLKHKTWKSCFYTFIPILTLLIFAFIVDGTTTFQTNPDSSTFGWIFFFSLLRILTNIILSCMILIIHYFKHIR